jgi:integrase
MPKKAKELGALEVGRIRAEGLHAVGGVAGLYLRVKAGGRAWVLRTVIGSKRRDMGLGGFPDVTLAQARDKARIAKQAVESGSDPILQRQQALSELVATQASALTFAGAAQQYMDAKATEWKNAKHRAQWVTTLDTYAAPVLGKMQVADIKQEHVLAVLQPIWNTKTETAVRLRGRIEQVLDWARVRGFRHGENPARWRGHLDMLLPKPAKIATVQHHPALTIDAIPAFMADLRQRDGTGARALELLALTAARSGEIRLATWNEFDLDAAMWVIPGVRMKAGKEHRVPLSQPALALLRALPRLEGCELVFPGAKGKALSDMTLTAIMRRMELAAVPHGLRSSFRDWVSERTTYSSELAEMALAHTIDNKVEAAYRRGDMLGKRVQMMADWAAHCGGIASNIGHTNSESADQ